MHFAYHFSLIALRMSLPRFACPCARISRHFIFIHRPLMWVWLRLTHVSVSPFCILYAIVALSMLAFWPCFKLENACFGAALLLYFHSMSILYMHCIAIGHFGCLNSHFRTIPCIWCHFAIFRDCFPPYFSAEIPLACLHIIFYVISCLNAISSVCVPVCTHFEALHFHLSASYVSVAEVHSC